MERLRLISVSKERLVELKALARGTTTGVPTIKGRELESIVNELLTLRQWKKSTDKTAKSRRKQAHRDQLRRG